MYKYIVAPLVLLLTDLVWIFIIKNKFSNMIGNIQGEKMIVNIPATILAYVCLVVLYNFFVLRENKTFYEAFLLGLLVYGVYEFTNKALIKNWQIDMVIFDTLWGGVLFLLVTLIMKLLKNKNLL